MSKTISKTSSASYFAEEIIIAEEHFFIPYSAIEQKTDFRLIVGEKSDDIITIFNVPQNPAESILSGTVLHPSYSDQGKARLAFYKARREFELAETIEERIRLFKHLYALAEAHNWVQHRVLQLIHEACHQDSSTLNTDQIHLFNHTFSKWIANDDCDLVLIAKSLILLLHAEIEIDKAELLETAKRLHHKAPLESHFTQVVLAKPLSEIFAYFLNGNYESGGLANYWMEHALKRLMEDHTFELQNQIIHMMFSEKKPSDFFTSFLNQLGKQSYFDTAIDFLMIAIKEKSLIEANPKPSILALVGYYELYCYASRAWIKPNAKQVTITASFKEANWKLHAIPSKQDDDPSQSLNITIKNLNLASNADYLNELKRRISKNPVLFKTPSQLHNKCCKSILKSIQKTNTITLNHFELLGQSALAIASNH
ncbi:MAG: hypothetical protein O3A01_02500 [bacterium]|nr:hypothetical protein [bacterium]